MIVKDGVILSGLSVAMTWAMGRCEFIFEKNFSKDLVITCGLDGIHSAGSLHYSGNAVDIRTRHLTDDERRRALDLLRAVLGNDFDVVLHSTHIHVEYQRAMDEFLWRNN